MYVSDVAYECVHVCVCNDTGPTLTDFRIIFILLIQNFAFEMVPQHII